jgi:hypothetical protein
MKITLAKALKVKNQVAGKINRLSGEVQRYNVVLPENKDKQDVGGKFAKLCILTNKLIDLKASISAANAPIQRDIYALAEKKGFLSFLQNLNCDADVRRGYNNELIENYAHIGREEVDKLITVFERDIIELQDKLDNFNALTKIEVDDELLTV